MTPEAQRIGIAEACGFVNARDRIENGTTNVFGELVGKLKNGSLMAIPNYPYDLNAMHEAEKGLTAEQEEQYVLILEELITPDFLSKDQTELSMEAVMFRDVHATAAQRAEAFLRTLGKWKE